ncbi:hypothetical protein LTS10_007824 [Elasticomyces elasticus]|nr:hypothetical protein LTS10_007824 [Elasticomyces elasticus]
MAYGRRAVVPYPVKYDFSENIHVLVGVLNETTKYIICKDLITHRSGFFRSAVAQRWNASAVEGVPITIELPRDKPATFSDYLQCLYTGEHFIRDLRAPDEIQSTIDAYVLADRLGDLRAANCIIDSIIKWSAANNCVPCDQHIEHIYKNTLPGSNLRRLFLDYYITLSDKSSAQSLSYQPFCVDVLRDYARVTRGFPQKLVGEAFGFKISARPKCEYHRHDESYPSCN